MGTQTLPGVEGVSGEIHVIGLGTGMSLGCYKMQKGKTVHFQVKRSLENDEFFPGTTAQQS